MSTAIDFVSLLREERSRRRRKKVSRDNRSNCSSSSICERSRKRSTSTQDRVSTSLAVREGSSQRYVRRKKINLELFRLKECIDSIFYVKDFITCEEEKKILADVDRLPWISLRRRKLQNHGGTPHHDGMFRETLPSFLQHICDSLVETDIFPPENAPNHVLVNSYARGQGIAPHMDGPLYDPCVAIVTLDGPARLDFFSSLKNAKDGHPATSVLCEPRSLLVFRDRAYSAFWHGIRETSEDRVENCGNLHVDSGHCVIPRAARRVSLTIRRVPNIRDETKRFVTAEACEERHRKSKWWVESRGEGGR